MPEKVNLNHTPEASTAKDRFETIHSKADVLVATLLEAKSTLDKTRLPLYKGVFTLDLETNRATARVITASLYGIDDDEGPDLYIECDKSQNTKPYKERLHIPANRKLPISYTRYTFDPNKKYGEEGGTAVAAIDISENGVTSRIKEAPALEEGYKGLEDFIWDLHEIANLLDSNKTPSQNPNEI